MSDSEVYRYPRYYAIGYQWNTEVECDFIEGCLKAYGPANLPACQRQAQAGLPAALNLRQTGAAQAGLPAALNLRQTGAAQAGATRLLDIGCGAGRHLMELARRGHQMTGIDLRPEMVAYVEEEARKSKLRLTASVDDLRHLTINGTFDAAYCFMDTFRFLLTNHQIIEHLRAVAKLLVPGGLYLTDFWVPSQWDQIGNEIHQWEQTQGETTVRVFYLQHPESADPITQTFEDELVFEVHEGGQTKEIRGGPTRTRLILPQEFRALVESSGVFSLKATHGEFDLTKPLDQSSLSWRMISVLQKR